jgi:hypothetical protein
MWIGRKNGREKYQKGQLPRFCPKCKTSLWNSPYTSGVFHKYTGENLSRLNAARKWYQRHEMQKEIGLIRPDEVS